MINYLIQVILFQVLFVAVYDFFLSKETFFNKNRGYLLSTVVLSFLLPLFKIPTVQKAVPQQYYTLLPEVVLSPQKVLEKAAWYQSVNYLDVVFWCGCFLFFVMFLVKLERIIRLILKYGIRQQGNYKLVLLPKETKAFSFFNYIFLGNEIPTQKREKIIEHELVHSEQKHTVDLLFFELLKIGMWFNPMVYVYQNRISLVHEYISDAVASKSDKKENYINHLLADIFQVEHISFINQFYKHSIIKKRIAMITKTPSKKVKQLKYLVLIPLLGSMLLYTSCTSEQDTIEKKSVKQPIKVYEKKDGKIVEKASSGYQSKYLDLYLGDGMPSTREYAIDELTEEERDEYAALLKSFNKIGVIQLKFRVFEAENGRRMVALGKPSIEKYKELGKTTQLDAGVVPFSLLDKAPTFPGCAEGDKDCFNKSMMKFVQDNFDTSITKGLDLTSGKQRVYVRYKINKDGNVTGIEARAPHATIKEHVEALVRKLPQMQPGEHNGKKVSVGYTLPITFEVK
ncbi:M56 family metallopeptidase [Tenacibaculum tangerinum]|uniref:M56 family metallopeptidase n=1 Tax=Tenacibaculum tangerinum TaxID=3038772 RepID=A0ABY8L6L9_9FLAO|nr:M56 family metallopeptidase [Tenacibaculum tangerinum]WGH77035.1 M56 family metallopeptidase [Tenacibaculum tangerinum]